MKSETLFFNLKSESYSITEMQQPRLSGLEIGGSNPSNFRICIVRCSNHPFRMKFIPERSGKSFSGFSIRTSKRVSVMLQKYRQR